MKRDMELVRKILLRVEADGGLPNQEIRDFTLEGYPREVLVHHLWLLNEAGLLEAKVFKGHTNFDCVPICLTWRGTEFLDDVRDEEVWRKTKAGAAKAGGAGLDLMWDLAKAYAKAKLSETLGVTL
jgi:hypothetical protein